ncbi:hypothetical protein L1887_57907 [Cichorium endivia]|nr:hypothetical protein L1887_57907 [Cichorium endivia]
MSRGIVARPSSMARTRDDLDLFADQIRLDIDVKPPEAPGKAHLARAEIQSAEVGVILDGIHAVEVLGIVDAGTLPSVAIVQRDLDSSDASSATSVMLALAIRHLDTVEPLDHPATDLSRHDKAQWVAMIWRKVFAVQTPGRSSCLCYDREPTESVGLEGSGVVTEEETLEDGDPDEEPLDSVPDFTDSARERARLAPSDSCHFGAYATRQLLIEFSRQGLDAYRLLTAFRTSGSRRGM